MGLVVKAVAPAYGGYSIAREDKVILIKGAIPGEVVEIVVEEKRRDYAVASVVSVIESSADRVEPGCPVFGLCGGCQLQFMSYDRQLKTKDEVLVDSLGRLGGIEAPLSPAFSGGQWNYRHRAQFKVSKSGEIGFYRESSRDVVTFRSCPLMTERINGLLVGMKERDLGCRLSEIHIAAGDTPVALLKGRDYDSTLFDVFVEVGLSGVAYNDAIAYGGAYTGFDLNGLRYTVSPWTFFQSNWDLNKKVADYIVGELSPLEGRHVLDLYAGAGNFSLTLAALGGEVVAVEENPYAAEDARRNVEINDIRNCRVVRSSAEKFRINRKFDILLLDPPRPGLTSEAAKKILETPPERIVYISCNPATLARDLKKLRAKYDVESVRQIDFFPNTFHVEASAFLRLR